VFKNKYSKSYPLSVDKIVQSFNTGNKILIFAVCFTFWSRKILLFAL